MGNHLPEKTWHVRKRWNVVIGCSLYWPFAGLSFRRLLICTEKRRGYRNTNALLVIHSKREQWQCLEATRASTFLYFLLLVILMYYIWFLMHERLGDEPSQLMYCIYDYCVYNMNTIQYNIRLLCGQYDTNNGYGWNPLNSRGVNFLFLVTKRTLDYHLFVPNNQQNTTLDNNSRASNASIVHL